MAAYLPIERGVPPQTAGSAPVWSNFAAGSTLALRYVQARFLSLWGLLVAAALCPPQVFADFALFSALANFLAIAAFMRFEAMFFQNADPQRLGRAFRLSLATGLGFMAVCALAAIAMVATDRLSADHALFFLIALAGRAAIRLVSSEATAEADFAAVGNCNVVQALVQPVFMVLLIWLLDASPVALFAADAAGHAVCAVYIVLRRKRALSALVARANWSVAELRVSAQFWRAAPRLLLPSTLLSFGFTVLPLLALPYAASPVLAAHVALSMRLLDMPTQMFASVSVPLVMSNLRRCAPGARQDWIRRTTILLIGAAVALFAAIAIAARGLDGLLDDTQWAGIGDVIAVLAVFYVGVALVQPLHEVATLSRRPQRQVITNVCAVLAAAIVMLAFGKLSMALLCGIGMISLARMLAHVQFAWTRFGTDGVTGTART